MHQASFDAELASELLKADLDGDDLELYASVQPEFDDYGELVLTPDRSILDAMPGGGPFSGTIAFRTLFPEDTGSSQ